MRFLTLLVFICAPLGGFAQDWEDQRMFSGANAETALRILSSTDTSFFAPVVEGFIKANPSISVEYLVTSTAELDRQFRLNPEDFDVIISSAMDLQFKLANDGLASQILGIDHPDWAQWHNSLFAFTSEPAAIVVNQQAFRELSIPQNRQDLIQLMRDHPVRFQGKVGTYDVRESGLGYLFASQDARATETYWRLTEIMGGIDARLYCCSGQMIDDLISGQLIMAYNVLGSYAQVRSEYADDLLVILPSEFPTTMMRTVFISSLATHPEAADAFVRYLLNFQNTGEPTELLLPPLPATESNEGQATIRLNPGIMTYLDQMKRETFVREWEDAIIQNE